MADQPRTGFVQGKSKKNPLLNDLTHLATLGARTRRMRYLRDAATFLLPVLLTIVIQTLVYILIYTRAGQIPMGSGVIAAIVLGIVPVLSAFTLSAFRRHEAPILAAVAVVSVYFSFAVSFLSAIRIPLSYTALAAAAPIAMAIMAFANVRFHRSINARVGLIRFKNAATVLELLGTGVALIDSPDADVGEFDAILIEPRHHHTTQWSGMLTRSYLSGVDIMPWARFVEIRLGRVDIATFDLSHLSYSPSQLIYARFKRILDLAFVVVTLPLSIPLAALTGAYIFLRDGGPVLFVQHRRGFGGRPFRLYKFRTMYSGKSGGATSADDKRVIPGCGVLRRTRIDELPQLFNVLIGDMSLIGPRPEALDLVRWYRREIPQWDYRMLLLPGITGWAQVNSGYTSNPSEARVKLSYDLYYIKHLSLDLDLQILVRTIKTVLLGSGAR
ncbi:sugar transferase [Pelagibacterium sediminicola]|uniref:sugar transferase n=1 Tax=Pelagibacterium sediminicola TaxID=2248761 RepID=UPI000E323D5C|nr:sugar transferase [Pelagibacterium sediminicola]